MATPIKPNRRLRQWLEELSEWSVTLDPLQVNMLAADVADLFKRLLHLLQVDESDLEEITDFLGGCTYAKRVLPETRAQVAKMVVVCRSPRAFMPVELHEEADDIFERLLEAALGLREHVECRMTPDAWCLFGRLQRLPRRAIHAAPGAVGAVAVAITELYERMIVALEVNTALLEKVRAPCSYAPGWKRPFPDLVCHQAVRLMELCRQPDLYVAQSLLALPDVVQAMLRDEAQSLRRLLGELRVIGSIRTW